MTQAVLLGDVVEVVKGISYRSSDYAKEGSGKAFVNLKCVGRGGGFRQDGIKYYKGEHKPEQTVEPGDVLIANTDLTQDRKVIGSPILMPQIDQEACFSLDLSKLVIKKPDILDKYYLFYLLKAPKARNYMIAHSSGSTVMHLSVKSVPKMEVVLPDLNNQKNIGHFLRVIDEKIELNRRMNETLEKNAQVLFEHLFINNPEIKTWEIGPADKLFDLAMGLSPKGDSYNKTGDGAPLLNGAADFEAAKISPKRYTSSPTRISKPGDIIFCIRGTIGNVCIGYEKYCLGRGVAALTPKEKATSYVYFSTIRAIADMEAAAAGSVIRGLSKDDIAKRKISIPPSNILEEFENTVRPIVEKLRINAEEAVSLTSLRDSLLPHLISGKVKG